MEKGSTYDQDYATASELVDDANLEDLDDMVNDIHEALTIARNEAYERAARTAENMWMHGIHSAEDRTNFEHIARLIRENITSYVRNI